MDDEDEASEESANSDQDFSENITGEAFEIKILTSDAMSIETQTARKFSRVMDYLTMDKLRTDSEGTASESDDLFPDWAEELPKRKVEMASKNRARIVNGNGSKGKRGLPREALITPKNATTMRWPPEYSILSIDRCCNILPIENVCREAVTSITFSHLIVFQNVLTFLQKCPNLKDLSFVNIKLDPRNRIGSSSYNIYCNNLGSLSFSSSQNPLSFQEYSLLDFFHRSVSCPQLKSFGFSGVDILQQKTIFSDLSPSSLETSGSSSSMESVAQKLEGKSRTGSPKFDPSLVGLFLIKNHPSLKFISCGGAGCQIFERGMDTEYSEMINTVQIDSVKFGVDTKGVEYILQAQASLKCLTCCGFTSEISPKFNRTICSCIENNCGTLNSVAIFPCIISTNLVDGIYDNIYALNCQVFERCFALQKLYISVNYAESEKGTQHPCGTILNMHLLPFNLVHLEIYTSEFHQKELQLLAQNFGHFQRLKRLALSSSGQNRYIVEPSWIQVLLALPKLLTLDFLGGRLANLTWLERYVRLNHEDMILTHDDSVISLYKRSYLLE